MSFRLPQNLGRIDQNTVLSALDYEIMGEAAASLGQAGQKVEQALAQLSTADAPDRDKQLKAAACAVHAYFIQRELFGLKSHDNAIRDYNIPRAVLARLGAL
ncbi:hypothetical protein HB779_15865 [Phyllobacterium sp. 628]|uniref:DUF6665 family protein n=1 Tax=Phyllobacterium sp. 628 TaxID=2718938 RepID=UPI00166277A7|nr:DUF6665 family protein [Phyllobacterium sp. 628]QND53205.1 hypothetical protein HB779_15865 [Phyllobacterium sp. 628]